MSQTETVPTGDKSATLAQVAPQQDSNNNNNNNNNKKNSNNNKKKNKKSKKPINPEYVKSPPPTSGTATAAAAGTTTTNSRPNSRAGSLKASFGSKSSGFLSLLLCCTAGAGSLLDNTDKSSSIIRRRRKDHNNNNNNNSNNNNKEEEELNTTTHATNTTTTTTTTTTTSVTTEEENENETERLRIRTDPNDLNPQQQVQQDDSYDCISTTPNSIPQQSPAGQMIRLLPPVAKEHIGRKCLVLDLDETLVHSSFKVIPHPDFIVPVEIDNQYHNVYVLKRPGVDEFMRKMGEKYEIVVFTASLSKYADPVLDKLDIHKVVKHRLFREACCNHKGNYVKDLSHLGRDLTGTMILDNSPASYIFHNANAVPVSTWFNDPHDTELTDLVAFLEDLTQVDDVTMILDNTLSTHLHPFSTSSFASA